MVTPNPFQEGSVGSDTSFPQLISREERDSFVMDVLNTINEAEKSANATLAGMLEVQSMLSSADKKMHDVLRDKSNTIAILGSLKALIASKFPTLTAKTSRTHTTTTTTTTTIKDQPPPTKPPSK